VVGTPDAASTQGVQARSQMGLDPIAIQTVTAHQDGASSDVHATTSYQPPAKFGAPAWRHKARRWLSYPTAANLAAIILLPGIGYRASDTGPIAAKNARKPHQVSTLQCRKDPGHLAAGQPRRP
jgi:hypothetical protein